MGHRERAERVDARRCEREKMLKMQKCKNVGMRAEESGQPYVYVRGYRYMDLHDNSRNNYSQLEYNI